MNTVALSVRAKVFRLLSMALFFMWSLGYAVLIYFLILPVVKAANLPVAASKHSARFVSNKLCTDCHAEQAQAWLGSDHEQAMQVANGQTVLGDFNNVTFSDAGVHSRFFQKDQRYFINTIGPDGQYADFEVKYTFGVRPLQQYLLQLPKGRLQAFTVAWDTQKKQWFDLYPGETFKADSPLHWSGRAFTANSSCMECHMTNMALNFDVKTAQYHSTWSEVNVSCQSCHGPGSEHVEWVQRKQPPATTASNAAKGLIVNYQQMRPDERVDSCARCHARRYAVSQNDAHGRAFFDDFMPELLREGVYHSDGQILDEVYVYGSFTQSKMYQHGVSCMDCHNPHSLKVRASDNGLCVRCHQSKPPSEQFASLAAKNYDTAAHHFHPQGSKGAQCVNCHMPETIYMQVDPRRDHRFSIPRPDLSRQWGVPNACTQCHNDKSAAWAVTAMNQWYGKQWQQRPNIAATISQARRAQTDVLPSLLALIKASEQPAIVRATALDLMPGYGYSPLGLNITLDALADASPLVRATALRGLDRLPEKHKFKEVTALLNDPVQGVRIEAARLLAATPRERLSAAEQQQFARALDEYKAAQLALNDHPEGYLNLGNLYASMRKAKSAEQAYLTSIRVDAYFAPAYSSLANLYYATGRKQEAAATFRKGLQFVPEAASLHYSLGLLLVEQQQLVAAAEQLKKAAHLMPQQAHIHYNYGLLLQRLGQLAASEKVLLQAYALAPDEQRILSALIALYKQQGQPEKAEIFIQKLRS